MHAVAGCSFAEEVMAYVENANTGDGENNATEALPHLLPTGA